MQRDGTLKCLGLKTLESYKLKFPSRAKLCSEKKLLGVESKLNWTSPTPRKKGAKEREVPNKKDEDERLQSRQISGNTDCFFL